jgi:hypothetical protein
VNERGVQKSGDAARTAVTVRSGGRVVMGAVVVNRPLWADRLGETKNPLRLAPEGAKIDLAISGPPRCASNGYNDGGDHEGDVGEGAGKNRRGPQVHEIGAVVSPPGATVSTPGFTRLRFALFLRALNPLNENGLSSDRKKR